MTKKKHKLFSFLIFLIMILIVLLLGGCGILSPDKKTDRKIARHLRKSDRHLKAAIALGAEIDRDTTWRTISIPVPEVKTDTVFKPIEGDTVYIEKDRLKILYTKLPGDSVYIYGESQADTVYKDVFHTVTNEIACPPKDNTWKWIAIALGVVLILIFLVMRR